MNWFLSSRILKAGDNQKPKGGIYTAQTKKIAERSAGYLGHRLRMLLETTNSGKIIESSTAGEAREVLAEIANLPPQNKTGELLRNALELRDRINRRYDETRIRK